MKTNSLRLLFAVFACIFIGVCGMSAAGKSEDVKEEVIPLPRPIPQDQVTVPHIGGPPNSTLSLSRWQTKNPNRQIQSAEPVIKDNALVAWIVTSKNGSFDPTFFDYVPAGKSFFLPESMSTDDVLKEVWKRTAKGLERISKPKPVAVNLLKQADGKTVVYGVWYSYKDQTARLVNGQVKRSNEFDSEEEFRAHVARMASYTMPLPEVVTKNPERYIVGYHAPSEGDVVMMKPFEVRSDKLWGNWEFHYVSVASKTTEDGGVQIIRKSDYVTVTSVDPVSPAAQFGFKSGMYVWSLNGVSTVGLSSNEEFKHLVGQVSSGDMKLEVSDSLKGEHYFITIPMDKLEAARNKVPTIAALP